MQLRLSDAAARTASTVGFGCGLVFHVIFALIGGFALIQAYQQYLAIGLSFELLPWAGVGVAFFAVGCGGLWRMGRQRRRAREDARLLEEHADAPWRVRPAWREGRIAEDASSVGTLAVFALIWNVLTWPVALVITRSWWQGAGQNPWPVWIFPAIGLGLAAFAVWPLLRRWRHGRSVFVMETLPGRIGGRVAGTIRTQVAPGDAPAEGFAVTLGCYRRAVYHTRDSDGDRRRKVSLEPIWEDERKVTGQPASMTLHLPIDVALPPGLDASTPLEAENRILWRLKATADVPGIDYAASFEIPVFEPDEAAPSETEQIEPSERAEASEAPPSATPSQEVPWTVRPEWASGRIKEEQERTGLARLFIGLLLTLGAGSGALFLVLWGGSDMILVVLFALIFAAIGGFILYGAVRTQMQRRRFTASAFEMDTVPARLGHALRGTVATGLATDVAPADGFHVTLSCFERRLRRDGDGDRRVDLTLRWRDERRMKGTPSRTNPGRWDVPVRFSLPEDAPPATALKRPNRTLWRLDVAADIPGVDYEAQFEVPVFAPDAEATTPAPDAADATAAEAPADEHEIQRAFAAPVSPGLGMERTAGGGTRFTFGAARDKKSALILTAIFLVMAALTVVSLSGGGLLFFLVMGIFAGLTGYGALYYWTYASAITVERGQVTVQGGLFGRGETTTFDAAYLTGVQVAAQQGGRYDLHLACAFPDGSAAAAQQQKRLGSARGVEGWLLKAGVVQTNANGRLPIAEQMAQSGMTANTINAARMLGDKAEADWIAAEIQALAAQAAQTSAKANARADEA